MQTVRLKGKHTHLLKNTLDEVTFLNSINKGSIEIGERGLGKMNKTIKDQRTALILKDSAIKSNNQINALKLRAIEFDKLKKGYNQDNFVLSLLKVSNMYDLSFVRGFIFTIGTTILFTLLIISFGFPNYHLIYHNELILSCSWVNIIDQFLNILNVFNSQNIEEYNLKGKALFLLSKAFVSFGIYQTIYAFYKYMRRF